MALIIMWNRRNGHHIERFRNVGRMALTDYLAQTILGVTLLTLWAGQARRRWAQLGVSACWMASVRSRRRT